MVDAVNGVLCSMSSGKSVVTDAIAGSLNNTGRWPSVPVNHAAMIVGAVRFIDRISTMRALETCGFDLKAPLKFAISNRLHR